MKNSIIYSLNVEDVQTVAEEEIGRELNEEEFQLVKDLIAEKIDWYGALAEAIDEAVKSDEADEK